MVCFQTENPNVGKFLRVENADILYGHLEYSIHIWEIYDPLVHFVFIWNIFSGTKKNLAALLCTRQAVARLSTNANLSKLALAI
jgi:hypothetical protein